MWKTVKATVELTLEGLYTETDFVNDLQSLMDHHPEIIVHKNWKVKQFGKYSVKSYTKQRAALDRILAQKIRAINNL